MSSTSEEECGLRTPDGERQPLDCRPTRAHFAASRDIFRPLHWLRDYWPTSMSCQQSVEQRNQPRVADADGGAGIVGRAGRDQKRAGLSLGEFLEHADWQRATGNGIEPERAHLAQTFAHT